MRRRACRESRDQSFLEARTGGVFERELSALCDSPSPSRGDSARKRAIAVLVLAILALQGGCDPGSERSDALQAFDVRDSTGIEIRTTRGVTGRQPLQWIVDTIPDLELGGDEGGESQNFYRLRGMAQLTDGRIVVVDGSSAEIRLFDRAGQFLNRIGGKGNGPGEFRTPGLVSPADTVSLLIYDWFALRYTRLGLDGKTRFVSPPTRMRFGGPVSHVGDRVLVRETSPRPVGAEGQHLQTAHLSIVDAESLTADTIGEYPGLYSYAFRSREGDQIFMELPFDVMSTGTADATGFLITAGEGPEIVRYDTTGRVTAILRLEEEPYRITERELDAQAAGDPGMTPEIRERFSQMDLPETVPSFIALQVDDLGWLWAETYRFERNGPRTWVVFDPDGRARGSVMTPARVEVHQIGADFILGLWRDSLNVEYVRRYPLSRAGMESR